MLEILKELTPETRKVMDAVIEGFMSHSLQTRAATFEELNMLAEPGGIVFAGDSITEGYPIHELYPSGLQLYNRGIGGITSRQLLDAIDTHILGLRPGKVFLLIGTNDIQKENGLDESAERIRTICEKTVQSCPETEVYVLAVYPTNITKEQYLNAVGERDNKYIRMLNESIEEKISGMAQVTYIDLGSVLGDDVGNLREAYTTDGLHLSVGGYREVTKQLLPYVFGRI